MIKKALLSIAATFYLTTVDGAALSSSTTVERAGLPSPTTMEGAALSSSTTMEGAALSSSTTIEREAPSSSMRYGWYPSFHVTNLTSARIDKITIRIDLSHDSNSIWYSASCTDSNRDIVDPGNSLEVFCNQGYQPIIEQYRFRRIAVYFSCYKGPNYEDSRAIYVKDFPEDFTWYDASLVTHIPPGRAIPIALEETTWQNLWQDGICWQGDGAETLDNPGRLVPLHNVKKSSEKLDYKKEPFRPGGG